MSNRIGARLLLVSMMPLVSLAGGCATGDHESGMSTTLDSGQSLAIVVDGAEGRVLVKSEGPGQVVLRRQGGGTPEIRVGTPGDVLFTTRGREAWTMVNESPTWAAVDIRVSGADYVDIRGPVAGPRAR